MVAVCNQSRWPGATASSVDGVSAADLESIGTLYAGRVAQLEEHYLDTVGVIGSSPVAPIIDFNELGGSDRPAFSRFHTNLHKDEVWSVFA